MAQDRNAQFRLRFDVSEIHRWASGYDTSADEQIEAEIVPRVQALGYYSKPDFLTTCKWKTLRTARRCAENTEEFIRAATTAALSEKCEQLRIEVLTLLAGVSWPTASVLLHFGHRDLYPILDFRALWSLRIEEVPDYDFAFWWPYVEFTRALAQEAAVSMRTLDRALWQYSKLHQSPAPSSTRED